VGKDPSRACVTGPLEPYAAGFAAELSRLGYASGSAYAQMLLMGQLRREATGAEVRRAGSGEPKP